MNKTVAWLALLAFTIPALSQTLDVPMMWNERPVEENITAYHIYHRTIESNPWTKVGTIPVVDSEGVRLLAFEPRFTHPAVDFTGGIENFYSATAENVPGLESQKSIALKLMTPGRMNKLKLDKN